MLMLVQELVKAVTRKEQEYHDLKADLLDQTESRRRWQKRALDVEDRIASDPVTIVSRRAFVLTERTRPVYSMSSYSSTETSTSSNHISFGWGPQAPMRLSRDSWPR